MAFYNKLKFLCCEPDALRTVGGWHWVDQVAAGQVFAMLIASAATLWDNPDHNEYADVSAAEFAGTGYSPAGGLALSNTPVATTTEDDANDRAEMDAADLTFTGLLDSFTNAVIVYTATSVGDNATSDLLWWATFGSTEMDGRDFILQWDAQGLAQIT